MSKEEQVTLSQYGRMMAQQWTKEQIEKYKNREWDNEDPGIRKGLKTEFEKQKSSPNSKISSIQSAGPEAIPSNDGNIL